MYVTKIDDIINEILDNLYYEKLVNDPTFKKIIGENIINFVEFRDEINQFIKDYIDSIDIDKISSIISNKENIIMIIDIIKRYVAYYYFLLLGFYYTGSIKDYRNNLIQYSKLQQNATFTIKNFFDTENNYQIIYFYKIIRETMTIVTLTDIQKKTLNMANYRDTIDFLNSYGQEYVDTYILRIVQDDEGNPIVEIDPHNLIKTIVFGEIYRNQEQNIVFGILNEIEESKTEYTYINIVVTAEDAVDYSSFRQMFTGYDDPDTMALNLYELVNDINIIKKTVPVETKNNKLLELFGIVPISDEFLRYHRETERLETDSEKNYVAPITGTNASKNVQLAILYQQRKKKENTKAQLIVTKIDAISDYYSENVKGDSELRNNLKKFFTNPFSQRKAVMMNYLEELHVMNKIVNMGKKAMDESEYFLELQNANLNAYYNFKEFEKNGTMLILDTSKTINFLRFSNIEYQSQLSYQFLELKTSYAENTIALVGFAIAPLYDQPTICIRKENMVDIRDITLKYRKDNKIKEKKDNNGYKMFLAMMKRFYVDTLTVKRNPIVRIGHDRKDIASLNPELKNKIIYWTYDIDKDSYKMPSYENVKAYNLQDNIKYMNANIYDYLMDKYMQKLNQLVAKNSDIDNIGIDTILYSYSSLNRMPLDSSNRYEIIVKNLLKKKEPTPSDILIISDADKKSPMDFETIPDVSIFKISIDMVDPINVTQYVDIKSLIGKKIDGKETIFTTESRCQHEIEWKEVSQYKKKGINEYNNAITQFIEKFTLQTSQLDFVCRICGQILPIKQYVQDGKFDSTTRKFVTNYMPANIPLDEIREYKKYKASIKYLDTLVNRLSLITKTNVFTGGSRDSQQRRKALVKNILDIIIKHNSFNMKKNISHDDRISFMQKKFNISGDLDAVFFFEMDDNIFNFTVDISDRTAEINRYKFNNVLIYFVLIFILELNGTQISLMDFDKIANIHTYLKYGTKLFGDLLLKKNINDMETVPITKYPVLCYLLFLISYYLIKYKLWYNPSSSGKTFDPVAQKIIINSFVDVFNSISMDASKLSNDYIYSLTISKMYSQLNHTFKNRDIISILKNLHMRYGDKTDERPVKTIDEELLKPASPEDISKLVIKKGKLGNFKISNGIFFGKRKRMIYIPIPFNTNTTNCKTGKTTGDFHEWKDSGAEIKCIKCGIIGNQTEDSYNSTLDSYYFNLKQIAQRRCLSGKLHDFVGEKGEFICTICKKKKGHDYNKNELDTLAKNLMEIEDENIAKHFERMKELNRLEDEKMKIQNDEVSSLKNDFKKQYKDKLYGSLSGNINRLMDIIESLIGKDVNLDVGKYPVYLKENTYVIDHAYDGTPFQEPIIFTEKENKIMFKENHPFFKADVYYYSDNRTGQIDVFYHAITLRMLGYKEKHKDYILKKSNDYLIINYSIRDRLLNLGYESMYIDISKIFEKNRENYDDVNDNFHEILDNLTREHIFNTKINIDKFITAVYSIKYYEEPEEIPEEMTDLKYFGEMNNILMKYHKILSDIEIGEDDKLFDDWNQLRHAFCYEHVNWEDTDLELNAEQLHVNSNSINYYDISSSMLYYYLVKKLIELIDFNKEKINKINIAQMYVEIINYIYRLYNIEDQRNKIEYKRFIYLLEGSSVMVDVLRRGQGLEQSKELEVAIEEMEEAEEMLEYREDITEEETDDLKEEAQALDVDSEYFNEDDADYEAGDFE